VISFTSLTRIFLQERISTLRKLNTFRVFLMALILSIQLLPSIVKADTNTNHKVKVPQIGEIKIDANDDLASVTITMDTKVPVNTFESAKGAKIIDFKGLRYGKPGYKERPESLLLYSIRIRPGQDGLRVVLNSKHLLPDNAIIYETKYISEKPPTYRISMKNILKSLIPKVTDVTTVVIDPGHGGLDPGNLGVELETAGKATYEKDITIAVSKKLHKLLNATKGYRSFLTRTEDIYVPLEDRTRIAGLYGADMMISIHCNAFAGKQSVTGFEIFQLSPKGEKLINKYLNVDEKKVFTKTMVKCFQLSQSIRDKMFEKTGLRDRGVKLDELIVTRSFEFPSILVETGFLTDAAEEKKLRDPAFQEKLAIAIRDGIILFEERHEAKWTGPVRPKNAPKEKTKVKPVPEDGYKVKPGDTVGKIAARFGVTTDAIAKKNLLKNVNAIQVGQILLIPPVPVKDPTEIKTAATIPLTFQTPGAAGSPSDNPPIRSSSTE
jgi:N-acetylmuramoyl-L-alanine amidase